MGKRVIRGIYVILNATGEKGLEINFAFKSRKKKNFAFKSRK